MSILELQNVPFRMTTVSLCGKIAFLLMVNLQEISPSITISRFLKSRFFLHLISRLNHMNVLLYKLLRGLGKPLYVVYWRGI